MFLPFDTPVAGKKALHRRSKTITVLVNTEKNKSASLNSKKLYSHQKNYTSTLTIKNNTQPVKPVADPEVNKNFNSLRKMTQQIQRLINRELCYPQLLTYVERGSSRVRAVQNQNPQRSQFNDTQYVQKHNPSLQTYTSAFRQPEYLTLLKKSQRLNSKSFIPHFNWKQKLTRMKNLGNYGNVYKKRQKASQTKITSKVPTQQSREYLIDSTKITIDPQIIINRAIHEPKYHRKGSTCKRCQTTCTDYSIQRERKYNQTCFAGEKLYLRKGSQTKPNFDQITYRKGKSSDRQWKFQPWDVKKDNGGLGS